MGLKIVSIKSSFPNKSETLNSKKYKKIIKATGINKRYLSSEKENVISLSIKSAKIYIQNELDNKSQKSLHSNSKEEIKAKL